jgi:hypothetical protein
MATTISFDSTALVGLLAVLFTIVWWLGKKIDDQGKKIDEKIDDQGKKIDDQGKYVKNELKVIAERATSIIDERTLSVVSQAVFALSVENKFHPIGVCFFISPDVAISCAHNFMDSSAGDFVWVKNGPKPKLKMRIMEVDTSLDIAVLSRVSGSGILHHLSLAESIPALGSQFIVASYNIGIMEELVEFKLSLGVAQGNVVKVSDNHFVYQSMTHGGDSGAALTLNGGKVIGMHLSGVNEARERLQMNEPSADERIREVESSIDGLIQGTSHGCVGLLSHVIISKLAAIM